MDISNPYRPNEPVATPEMLFGRREALDWLERQLNNDARTIVIKGSPQIGKTSLIKHANSQFQFEAYHLYISLYAPKEENRYGGSEYLDSINTVLRLVTEQMVTQLRLFNLASISSLNLQEQPNFLLRELGKQACQNLGGARLIIYFDDVHTLVQDDLALISTFLATLTPLLDDCPAMHMIFTTNQEILRRVHHPLIDRAPTFHLGALPADASINMVTLPVKNILRFDYGVTRRITEINSHHPYYLTLFCHTLLNRQQYDGWVNQRDFDGILIEILGSTIEPFTQIWNTCDWVERAVLAGMAAIHGTHGPLTHQEIVRYLQKIDTAVSEQTVINALDTLSERGVLVLMGKVSYRFHVELFRFWLREHANPYEVVREANWHQRPTRNQTAPSPQPPTPRKRESPAVRRQFSRLMIAVLVVMFCMIFSGGVFAARYLGVSMAAMLIDPTPTPTILFAEVTVTVSAALPQAPATETPIPIPTAPLLPSPVPVQVKTLPAITFMARDIEEGWKIYTMNSDGSEVIQVSEDGRDDRGPVWSTDGEKVVFISQDEGNREIYVMDRNGQNRINLTQNVADDWTPAWSPDGRQLAFASIRTGRWEIYVMDMTCLEEPITCPERIRQITSDGQSNLSPAWSPDGTRLAYNSLINGNWDIFTMSVGGTDIRQITVNPASELAPAWSPNGGLIAYESDQNGNVDVYVINANGGTAQNVTNYSLANNHGPTWSPDSQQLVFYSNREGNWDIFRIGLDGQNLLNMTQTATRDEQTPAWRP